MVACACAECARAVFADFIGGFLLFLHSESNTCLRALVTEMGRKLRDVQGKVARHIKVTPHSPLPLVLS